MKRSLKNLGFLYGRYVRKPKTNKISIIKEKQKFLFPEFITLESKLLIYIVNSAEVCGIKKAAKASYNSSNCVIFSLIHFFILAHNFSIGFKSGEYGGKNINLHPADSINSLVLFDLLNAALTIS